MFAFILPNKRVNTLVTFSIAFFGILFGFASLLGVHFRTMWSRPEYQYFPFVLAAIAVLLWQRGREAVTINALDRKEEQQIAILLISAWFILLVAVVFYAPLVAAAAAVLASACAFRLFFAPRVVVNKWGIWCLLWLLVPLPLGLDQGLTSWLQALSSKLSSSILDLLGVDHLMAANVLELPSKRLFVDEACSGIVSVMSVIACGAMWAVWKNRSLWHALLLIFSGTIWAMALNVARICSVAIAEAWFRVDWSTGTAHDILGLVLFLGTFVALISTDQLLLFLLDPIKVDAFWQQQVGENWIADLWNRFVLSFQPKERTLTHEPPRKIDGETAVSATLLIAPSVAFALLGLWQVPAMLGGSDWGPSVKFADTIHEQSLPKQVGNWQRIEYSEAERDRLRGKADRSKIFRYRLGDAGPVATFSLDFPFAGHWHMLDKCYQSSGWPQTALLNKSNKDEPRWSYLESEFAKPDETVGYLVYSFFNGSGKRMSAPPDSFLRPIIGRLMEGGRSSMSNRLFQVQVFLATAGALSEGQKQAAEELFLELSESLRAEMEEAVVGVSAFREGDG